MAERIIRVTVTLLDDEGRAQGSRSMTTLTAYEVGMTNRTNGSEADDAAEEVASIAASLAHDLFA